ncbi:MAG TPA: MFS transporter [Phototrophicaceae bacterium]|nr:MFS transporter [Phototrophicaceae bacterium]
MLAIFRNRNFTLLWIAGLISMTGDWVLSIGLPVFVYRLTGSTLATGGMLVAELIPGLVFGSVGGVFADRWDRRRLMILVNGLQALGLLPLLLVQSVDQLWIVFVVLFAEASLSRFFTPASEALLPLLVDETELAAVNTLNSLNQSLARLIGPAIGGLILATSSLLGVTVIDAASFMLAAILITLIQHQSVLKRSAEVVQASLSSIGRQVKREWSEGFTYVQRRPSLAALIAIVGMTQIGEGFIGTLIVPFVTQVMHGTESDYGYLMTCQAVGGIIGGILMVRIAKKVAPQQLFAVCGVLFGLLDLVIFYYPLWISGVGLGMALIALVGIPAVGFGTGFMTLMQMLSDDAYRGRVFGLFGALSALLMLIGAVLAGVLGDHVSIILLLTIQGGVYVLAGGLGFAFLQRTAVEVHPLSEPHSAQ